MTRKTPEGRFKEAFSKDLAFLFPGIMLLKNDEQLLQGVPDSLLLYNDRWAMLEFKASATADEQPNQRYYVELFDRMSYAAFVYPENGDVILEELSEHFG